MTQTELLKILEQHGILPTSQRLQIADVLLQKPQHLSAEQVIERLQERGQNVSKATVYNTLHLFDERGLVRELAIDASRKFYDSTTSDHQHFFNEDSGELCDIPADAIELKKLPSLPAGTVGTGIDIIIRVKNR